MSRAIVNVATGQYVKGQDRLLKAFPDEQRFHWNNIRERGYGDQGDLTCPTHEERPYAFKAYALAAASAAGVESLLWCDACIVPGPRPLAELWDKIETDGYWIARNGYSNYEWAADSAYPALFRHEDCPLDPAAWNIATLREINRNIAHVVATAFGISLAHPVGLAILAEYFRLASETNAFCGPWANTNHPDVAKQTNGVWTNARYQPCGPSDVRGHRHDQTALSVIAWRLGCQLTDCPEWFAYKGGETDKTCLVADGSY